jgi:hypothetical protein
VVVMVLVVCVVVEVVVLGGKGLWTLLVLVSGLLEAEASRSFGGPPDPGLGLFPRSTQHLMD